MTRTQQTERKHVQDRLKARKKLVIRALNPGDGRTGVKYAMPDNRGYGGIEKVFQQAGMKEVKFAFIIVRKRIKTKFFRDKENPQRHYRGRRGDTERKV